MYQIIKNICLLGMLLVLPVIQGMGLDMLAKHKQETCLDKIAMQCPHLFDMARLASNTGDLSRVAILAGKPRALDTCPALKCVPRLESPFDACVVRVFNKNALVKKVDPASLGKYERGIVVGMAYDQAKEACKDLKNSTKGVVRE